MIGIKLGLIFGGGVTLLQQAIAAIRRNNGTLIWVPDSKSGAYTDSAGTAPVTALADVMGLVLDGVGTVGPNLVTNGSFDSGITGWTASGNAALSHQAGRMRVERTDAAGYPAGQQTIALVSGKTYRLTCDYQNPSGLALYASFNGIDQSLGASLSGSISLVLTATGATTSVQVGIRLTPGTVGQYIDFDNIIVKEIQGNHASQSTTASKPLLTRVPKRLGPEMITSQDLTTWVSGGVFGNWGESTATANTITASGVGGSRHVRLTCEPGKTYRFSASVTGGTSPGYLAVAFGTSAARLSAYEINAADSSGAISTVLAAPSNAAFVEFVIRGGTTGQTTSFTNLTAGEVLEWTNAISFDGSNDFLQTGITTGNEGWVCAGVTFSAPLANYETVFGNGAGGLGQKGVWFVRLAGGSDSSALLMAVGSGDSLAQLQAPSGMNILGAARVVEGGWTASTVEVGVDGQTASAARTGDATPAPHTTLVGAYVSGFHHLGGPMTATVYCPVLPSAADRALIRSFVGALQGQSL